MEVGEAMETRRRTAKSLRLLAVKDFPSEAFEEDLFLAQQRWNETYSDFCTLQGWEPLGECAGRDAVETIISLMGDPQPTLIGAIGDDSLELTQQPFLPSDEPETKRISRELRALLRRPSLIIELAWRTADGEDFYTYGLAWESALAFDTLLGSAIVSEPRLILPTERNTDIFHVDFGWIWQSPGNYTRGFVHAELTVICAGGLAVNSRWSISSSMNLGSSAIGINPLPPALVRDCASTTYTWAVATGTITAAVAVGIAGVLTATFTGSFGSTANGSGTLLDCCKPAAVAVPVTPGGDTIVIKTAGGTTVTIYGGAPTPGAKPVPEPVEIASEQLNRGRLQVQDEDLDTDLSWPWTSKTPPAKADALIQLYRLRTQLTARQYERRRQAFARAERFIRQAPRSGVDAVVMQSFFNSPPDARFPNARVDIEVRAGKAFTD